MSQPPHYPSSDARPDFDDLNDGFKPPMLTPRASGFLKPGLADNYFDMLPKSPNISFDFSEAFSPVALRNLRDSLYHTFTLESKPVEQTHANTPDRVNAMQYAISPERPTTMLFADSPPPKVVRDVVPVVVDSSAKHGCVCKKTKCLKLYCECFANGGVCGPGCRCDNCHNTLELQDLRELIIAETLAKNPLAFRSKYKSTAAEKQTLHSRGCKCAKTGCQKNYCECYKKGLGCSSLCKCDGCNNVKIDLKAEDARQYHEPVLRKRKKANYIYDFYFEKYSSLKDKAVKPE